MADDLNAYFAEVATDPHYSQHELENLCCSLSRDSDSAYFSPFSDELFITVLGRVRSTSPGPEGIPFWFYKLCAVDIELGQVVAKLVNFSLARQKVPRTWRTATITPVPKTSIVTGPGDLRPISVTSILSCTVERLVVKNYLTPLLKSSLFRDQYAYKPTGCTRLFHLSYTYLARVQSIRQVCTD